MDAAALEAQGWHRLPTIRYSAAIGETWIRVDGEEMIVGLHAGEHLANDNLGIVHGGAMMTFGDMALGCAVGYGKGEPAHFVTAQLQFYFTAAARIGSFITCRPEVVRRTSQMVFVRGLFEADGRTVASADGIFKMLDADKANWLKAG